MMMMMRLGGTVVVDLKTFKCMLTFDLFTFLIRALINSQMEISQNYLKQNTVRVKSVMHGLQGMGNEKNMSVRVIPKMKISNQKFFRNIEEKSGCLERYSSTHEK